MFIKNMVVAVIGAACISAVQAESQFHYSDVSVAYNHSDIGVNPALKMDGAGVSLRKEIQNQIYWQAGLAYSSADQTITNAPAVMKMSVTETDIMAGVGRYFTVATNVDLFAEGGLVRSSVSFKVDISDTDGNDYGSESENVTETNPVLAVGARVGLVPGKVEFSPVYSYLDADSGAVKSLDVGLRFNVSDAADIGVSYGTFIGESKENGRESYGVKLIIKL